LGSFRKKPRPVLNALPWQFPKAYAWSATVVVNELDARLLKGTPQLLKGML
jgi:hypothetical protein